MDHVSRLRRGASLYSLVLRQTSALQAAVIALGLLTPALAVAPLHLQQRIIDDAIPNGDLGLLASLAGFYLAVNLGRSAIKFGVIFLRGWIAEIVERVLRDEVVDAQRRRQGRGERVALGSVTSVMTSEVAPLGGFAAEAINAPLIHTLTLAGVAGYMLSVEWALASLGLAALALEGIVTPLLQRRINRYTRRRIEALRRAGGDLIDRAGEGGGDRLRRSLGEVRRVYRLCLRMHFLKALLKVTRNLIDHAADLAILGVGALMVMRGQTELGVVVAFMSGVREVRRPWGELLDFYRLLADARVKHKLVRAVTERPAPRLTDAVVPA